MARLVFARGLGAAFFTPETLAMPVARNARCEYPGVYVDLGAGIGALTYWLIEFSRWNTEMLEHSTFYCIEESEEFCEVGRKVCPRAVWLCGDVFDPLLWMQIGRPDMIVSNPPYGQAGTKPTKGDTDYRGPRHFQFVDLAMQHAEQAVFILPSIDLPFEYNMRDPQGNHRYKKPNEYGPRLNKLLALHPDLKLHCIPEGFDDDFDGAKPNVNLVKVTTLL